MHRVGTFLKKIGQILFFILLVLVLVAGAFFVWLRVEPEAVTECEVGTWLFEHELGTTCVPDNPSNVLAYGTVPSQFFVAIERPMAMTTLVLDDFTAADIPGLYERLREVNEGTLDLGVVENAFSANLELLLDIQPDLIISQWAASDDIIKTTSLIAPVVFVSDLSDWKEVTLQSGEAIGEREEAEALIQGYEDRVEILRAQFDDPSEITVANIRLLSNAISVQLPPSFSGQIISEVGFSFPESQVAFTKETPDRIQINIDEERMDLFDADYLFIYPGGTDYALSRSDGETHTLVDDFLNDPLFPFLSVAESGQVYEADMHWAVLGIYSAHYLLDDLFRYVAGVDPEAVAPNPLLLDVSE
ncbi:MAG: ABC transporter substrate-binding protein [Chloroflexota bacterium]